jgi:hypothetical protein
VPLLLIWPLAHAVGYSLLRVPHYHWYYYPLGYVALVAAIVGVDALLSFEWSRGRAGRAAAWVTALLLLVAVFRGTDFAPLFERRGELVDRMVRVEHYAAASNKRFAVYREVSQWLNRQTGGSGAPVVLANEVGIMGYRSPGLVFRDSVGLATPGIAAEHMLNLGRVARRYRPEFIVVAARGRPVTQLASKFPVARPGSRRPEIYLPAADFSRDARFSARIYRRPEH